MERNQVKIEANDIRESKTEAMSFPKQKREKREFSSDFPFYHGKKLSGENIAGKKDTNPFCNIMTKGKICWQHTIPVVTARHHPLIPCLNYRLFIVL